MCNKLGCLSQGWREHAVPDTIEFIFHKDKPNYRICMRYLTPKNRDPQNKTHCRRESGILSRRGQHTDIRIDDHETPCKHLHLRRQIKIHVHERKGFLPKQLFVKGGIYHYPYFNDTTRTCENM